MISRVPIKVPEDHVGDTEVHTHTLPAAVKEVEETDGPPNAFMDMSAALPPKKNTKRAQVKNRDWRSSIQAYNEL